MGSFLTKVYGYFLMQCAYLKQILTSKSKEQINKQLNESIINGEQHENKGLQYEAEKVEKS